MIDTNQHCRNDRMDWGHEVELTEAAYTQHLNDIFQAPALIREIAEAHNIPEDIERLIITMIF